MKKRDFGKMVVFGVGLIGGSCALALKEKNVVREVIGIGRTQSNLDEAIRREIIDQAFTFDADWTNELAAADIVLLATPVAQTGVLLERILPVVSPRAIITEAGSTKQNVIAAAREQYRMYPRVSFSRFVPAHPIAGTEHSGAAAAFATLYEGRKVIITPLPETDFQCVEAVVAFWETCGAQVRRMSPLQHDTVFAAVSHLPHMLAFALVAELARRSEAEVFFQYAGSGFRDFTRIAASSPEMWRDIACDNREAVIKEIDVFAEILTELRSEIAQDDRDALIRRLRIASEARRGWMQDNDEK
ncbi:MAG: prephenate dehydrogenase/arogenate dehydrogenase family protein [Burkholderiales bacterium]|jgi:prephenate dehydrogenase|nr:prephenate dehydrogenase/arogenate dehydrogenase family protein [Burkholderiales bacterium]